MKKIIAALLAVLMLFTLAACGGNGDDTQTTEPTEGNEATAVSDLKIGVVLLHNETVGYDENFMLAVEEACDNLGIDKDKICTYCWTGKE